MDEVTQTSEPDTEYVNDGPHESIGRIEVAPGVLTTIAYYVTLNVDGINRMAPTPADVGQLFRRHVARNEGVILDYSEGNLNFDIYVLMDPHVNVRETSQRLQTAIIEAIDKMVGVPVDKVNIHVEDVVYDVGEAA
ncbi:MAG: Asp23/Gls24 family envelope stress response protein [Candidatus Promineifilaceae bacterium]